MRVRQIIVYGPECGEDVPAAERLRRYFEMDEVVQLGEEQSEFWRRPGVLILTDMTLERLQARGLTKSGTARGIYDYATAMRWLERIEAAESAEPETGL
jgi:hypothetical protein